MEDPLPRTTHASLFFAALTLGCSVGAMPDGGMQADGTTPDTGAVDAGRLECAEDFECDDRVACTIDRCTADGCDHSPCVDCCEDGLTCVPGFGCGDAPESCEEDADCQDAIRCTLDFCDDSLCRHDPQPALCGDGEICLAAVGCIPEPPTECETEDDCRVAACVGEWDCQPEFGCQYVSARDCDDADMCTVDSCSEAAGGCEHRPLDADTDGEPPEACGGQDCDDTDPNVGPDAVEDCDGGDEDCDGRIDEGCCAVGAACTTACGTPGLTTCDGQVSSCVTSEVCNGVDDDCDTEADEGFACVRGSSAACTTACGSTGTETCRDDCSLSACVPPAETCNGVDDNCNSAIDDGFPCPQNGASPCSAIGDWFRGVATCDSSCSGWDETNCTNCGDGVLDPGEDCDLGATRETECSAIGMGFGSGPLTCAANCTYDTSFCSLCGNGTVDSGEDCDGANLGGVQCDTVPGETFSGGTLDCHAPGASDECTFDTAMCESAFDPSGTYLVSPPVAYTCVAGIVSVSFGSLTFADDGSVLQVALARCPGGNLVGSSAIGGTISACCTLPGGGACDETYCLDATYSDNDTWSGTFSMDFEGPNCFDCVDQSFSVGGSR